MSYNPQNVNGQATMANSAPVVIASDQSTLPIGGNVAAAISDTGNPVKIGGKYNTTMPTYTNGQRGDLEITTRGAGKVALFVNDSATAVATVVTNADGVTASSIASHLEIMSRGSTLNGAGTWDRQVSVVNATNSTGTGIVAAGILAQLDDTTPTTITENQFGNLRMSANRNLYGTIRDAAGNERGANVTASNELVVSDSGLRPASTSLNTYATRITTNTTTTPLSSTAYISSIVITTEVGGTTSTVTIRDKQGTPQVLVNGLTTTAASLTPTVLNFQTPLKMTSGIDIITAGAVAGTVDVWINYYT